MQLDLDLTKMFQSGWFVAILATTWGIILRTVIGNYSRAVAKAEARLASMESRIAVIESRSHNRRKED